MAKRLANIESSHKAGILATGGHGTTKFIRDIGERTLTFIENVHDLYATSGIEFFSQLVPIAGNHCKCMIHQMAPFLTVL